MLSDETEIVKILSFQEIEQRKHELFTAIKNAQAELKKVSDILNELEGCYYGIAEYASGAEWRGSREWYDIDKNKLDEFCMKQIDYVCWKYFFDKTGLRSFMTDTAIQKAEQDLKESTIPFNAIDAAKTFEDMRNKRMLASIETVQTVFKQIFESEYYTGSGMHAKLVRTNLKKIEKSIRLTVGVYWDSRCCWWNVSHYEKRIALLNDLELACRIVSGKIQSTRGDMLVNKIRYKRDSVVSNEFFEVHLFKNGNIKIIFTDIDTLDKLNEFGVGKSRDIAGNEKRRER